MLLKFLSSDILNSTLIDVQTGRFYCKIATRALDSPRSSTSSSPCPTPIYGVNPEDNIPKPRPPRRKTWVFNYDQEVVAEIVWNGRRPLVTIGQEIVGGVEDLFDTSATVIGDEVLSIRSRFDSQCVWNATATSLTLDQSNKTKGTFYQKAIRDPSSPPTSPTVRQTRIPGLGNNYIEFEELPQVPPFEILVSFLIMEILRRGRFADSLTPYSFEPHQNKKGFTLKEVKGLITRLRRNTV